MNESEEDADVNQEENLPIEELKSETTSNTKNKTDQFVLSVIKYSVSPILSFIISFVTVIFLTRKFSPETYGLTNLFLTASGVCVAFFCFGFDSGMLRFYNEPPLGMDKKTLLSKCFIFPLIIMLIILLALSPFYGDVSLLIFKKYSFIFILALALSVVGAFISKFYIGYYRIADRAKKFTFLSVLNNSLSKVVLLILAFVLPSEEIILITLGISALVLGIVYLIIDGKQFFPKKISLSLKNFKPVIKYSLLLWPTAIILLSNTFISQLIVTTKFDLSATGIFTSVNFFVGIINVIQTGFTTYWATYMYANYKTDQNNIKRVQIVVLFFTIIMMCGIILLRDVAYLFIGKDYHASKSFFAFALLLPLINIISETTSYGITIAKKTQYTLICSAISIICGAVTSFFLVDIMGIAGASVGMAVSSLVLFILQCVISQKYYDSIGSYSKSIFTVTSLLVLGVLNYFLHAMPIILYSITGAILVVSCLIFRKEIVVVSKYVIRTFKGKGKKNNE